MKPGEPALLGHIIRLCARQAARCRHEQEIRVPAAGRAESISKQTQSTGMSHFQQLLCFSTEPTVGPAQAPVSKEPTDLLRKQQEKG